MTTKTFPVGAQVSIDPKLSDRYLGVTFTVRRILKTNVILDGPGYPRGLRCPMTALIEPQTFEDAVDAANAARSAELELLSQDVLSPGALVRVKARPGLWVVLKMTSSLKYQVARLGGDEGRYLSGATRQMLTPVDEQALHAIEAEYAA